MIIDTLNSAHRYSGLNPLFAKAFEFIYQKDLSSLEDGKFEITEGLILIVNTAKGKTKAASLEKFECHDAYIDIQICANGLETFGWKPRESCSVPNGAYNLEKDVRFYKDAPDIFFQLTNNQFAIFYPEDVHAPMIGDGEIKKLVFKVKI